MNFSKIQEFNLHPEQELRFEVEKGCWLKLEVVGTEGNAELFGTELIKNKPYYFNDGQGEFLSLSRSNFQFIFQDLEYLRGLDVKSVLLVEQRQHTFQKRHR